MVKMQGYLCLVASLLLSGVCTTPVAHKDDHSAHSKEHHDHLHHGKDQPHPHSDVDSECHKLAAPNADFAFDLYHQLNANDGKNIFYSPLSIASLLSFLALGAKGESHQQLFRTLGYSNFSSDDVNHAYEHLYHFLDHSQHALQLDAGNAMAIQQDFKPSANFLEDAKHYFDATAFTVNYKNAAEAEKTINDFIAKKTHDKITDLVKGVDQSTVMILLNYIFFRGKWEKTFDPEHTVKADFQVDENTKVEVDMMKRTGRYSYYYDDKNKASVVMLPYQGNASMLIVLPDEGKVKDVEAVINKENLKHWHDSMHKQNLDVHLPKFSASATYSLKDHLEKMGLVDIFSDSADLSGITGEVGLKVSKVAHKAVLNVDEKGTEAAGATAAEIMPMSMPMTMCISRPFLLFILEESTKSILFMGKITDPTAH